MNCNHTCGNCEGHCGSCGGCRPQLTITPAEYALLMQFAVTPFLPVAAGWNLKTPVYLEETAYTSEEYSAALTALSLKGLIRIDYDIPLSNFSYQAYADLIDEILKTLIEEEKGIELNTAGFREGLGQPNPCADIIKRYRELGGEIITVGSDAHEAANVGADFDKASDILTACGFKYYAIFEGRTPEYFKI